MGDIMSVDEVRDSLDDPRFVIVDCRFNLGDPGEGFRSYRKEHLPGAVYFDLEKDLSSPVSRHGGRHPLPKLWDFTFKLGKAGIDHRKKVVAYDDGGAVAARLWWLLKYYGHKDVYVLDEGYSNWKRRGFPTSAQISNPLSTQFVPHLQPGMLAAQGDVKQLLNGDPNENVLIDSRHPKRYSGEFEPIDAKAGHIPGAENWFWEDNLLKNGEWKTDDELKKRFAPLFSKKQCIVYCGSGVTACANVLGLAEAGADNVRLYAGSWSDWISYDENPVAAGRESEQAGQPE